MKETSAFALSSCQNGIFGFGTSKCPRLRPGTTTLGGGRWICIDALRRHLSGFQPSDRTWYAAMMARKTKTWVRRQCLQLSSSCLMLTPM